LKAALEEAELIKHLGALGRAVLIATAALYLAMGAAGQELRRSGFLGTKAGPMPEQMRTELHLGAGGVAVLGLVDAGSAKASGIEVNDVITGLAGRPVTGIDDFLETVRHLHGGDSVLVKLLRNGQLLTRTLLVKPRPQETLPGADVFYRAIAVDGTLRRAMH
jgi:S1-C subfamily serine protease